MTAALLKVAVAFPEMGPFEVLVLSQCVTCQSHPRSAREQTSDAGRKLWESYIWESTEPKRARFKLKADKYQHVFIPD